MNSAADGEKAPFERGVTLENSMDRFPRNRARGRRSPLFGGGASVLVILAAICTPQEAAWAQAPQPARRAFVTSTQGTADLGSWAENQGSGLTGIPAANHICQVRAESAGLAAAGVPEFRAWVSIDGWDAACNVRGLEGTNVGNCNGQEAATGPWARTDGVPFSPPISTESFAFHEMPLVPLNFTETGSRVDELAFVWTGTNVYGSMGGAGCSGWTSAGTGLSYGGFTTSISGTWTNGFSEGCGQSGHLYCFEQGEGIGPPALPPNPPGALAFFSFSHGVGRFSSWLVPGAVDGVAGADLICQSGARNAHLPTASSFRAWISDGEINAVDRIPFGGPWNRVDGVPLAASLEELTSGRLITQLNIDEYGRFHSMHAFPDLWVYTGTQGDGTSSEPFCSDWSSSSGQGRAGYSAHTNAWWTHGEALACGELAHLLCFGTVSVLFWDNFERENLNRWVVGTD